MASERAVKLVAKGESGSLEEMYGVRIESLIVSGRPTVTDQRVPVFVICGRFLAGDSPEAIAEDFDIEECYVLSAIRYGIKVGIHNL